MSNELITGSELAEFETPCLPTRVPPIIWSIEKERCAALVATGGKTKAAIAKEMGIPVSAINAWTKHPEFQERVSGIVMEAAKAIQQKSLQLKMKVLDAREAEAELNGYSTLTNKDTLDVMAEIRKDVGGDKTVDSSYTNLLEKLVLGSLKQPKVINVEGVRE